jgi:hypothetical protein
MWMSLDLEPRRLRALAPLLALCVMLLSGLSTSHAAPTATALTPEAIAEYTAKLDKARAARADLETRVTCLTGRDAALVAQRDDKQRTLGRLREQEARLKVDIVSNSSALDGFRRNLDAESQRLDGLRAELRRLEARKRAQDAEVADCKSRWWIPNFMCDFANEIAHLIGAFKNVQGEIDAQQRRVNSAQEGINLAWRNLTQSQQALAEAQRQAALNSDQIRQHEALISAIQSALSQLRPSVQSYRLLIDGLQDALIEAGKVDTADGRARTARTVQDLAGKIDEALQQTNQALAHARSALPPEVKSCVAA